MKKLEVIDKSKITKCWACKGTGYYKQNKKCTACEGTGKWREPNYIMVAEQPNGQKIALQSDFIK